MLFSESKELKNLNTTLLNNLERLNFSNQKSSSQRFIYGLTVIYYAVFIIKEKLLKTEQY